MATTKAYIPLEQIRDLSPLSIKNINDNFRYIQNKVQGNLGSYDISELSVDKLVAGTAKISTALIDELIVGTNVTMGDNATISWSNVTNQPSIPTTSDITAITASYVATPNLITNIAQVNTNLSLGTGYRSSSGITFTEQASITVSSDVMYISAAGGIIMSGNTSFSGNVLFDGATVSGLSVTAKFA